MNSIPFLESSKFVGAESHGRRDAEGTPSSTPVSHFRSSGRTPTKERGGVSLCVVLEDFKVAEPPSGSVVRGEQGC